MIHFFVFAQALFFAACVEASSYSDREVFQALREYRESLRFDAESVQEGVKTRYYCFLHDQYEPLDTYRSHQHGIFSRKALLACCCCPGNVRYKKLYDMRSHCYHEHSDRWKCPACASEVPGSHIEHHVTTVHTKIAPKNLEKFRESVSNDVMQSALRTYDYKKIQQLAQVCYEEYKLNNLSNS